MAYPNEYCEAVCDNNEYTLYQIVLENENKKPNEKD